MTRRNRWVSITSVVAMLFAVAPAAAHDDPAEPSSPAPLEIMEGRYPSPAAGAAAGSNAPRSFSPCVHGVAAGIYPCDGIDLMSYLPVEALGSDVLDAMGLPQVLFVNEIWGWTDPKTRTDYALVGTNAGMVIVDVSDAKRPDVIGILPTATQGAFIWRDIKVYADHAYVVSEDPGHGVQVLDLTEVRDAGDEYVVFEETGYYGDVGEAHNIAINQETGFAYVVGAHGGPGDDCAGGLHMLDLSDPADPTFVGCFAGHGYIHDTQCVIYHGPDADYQGRELCFNSAAQYIGPGFDSASFFNTLSIVDVTDKANPVPIANYEYANDGYSHQGWLTPDHRYFLHNDELDEIFSEVSGTATRIFDLLDLDAVTEPALALDSVEAIGHNAYTEGDRLIASNYRAGLRIYSTEHLADGELPLTGYFDVYPPDDAGVGDVTFAAFDGGSWGNYPFFRQKKLIALGQDFGLFLVRTRGNT